MSTIYDISKFTTINGFLEFEISKNRNYYAAKYKVNLHMKQGTLNLLPFNHYCSK